MQQKNRRALFTLCGVVALLMAGLLLTTHGWTSQVAHAQTDVEPGITAPEAGGIVTDTVTVRGTATHPAFLRYELYYKTGAAGEEAYIYFGGGTEEVIGGELGIWNTTGLQPGTYDLRLRVVRADGNYSEYVVPGLQVGQPVAEPTATAGTTATVTEEVTEEAPPTVTMTTTEPAEPTAIITATTAPSPTTEPAAPSPFPADAAQIVTDRNLNVRGGPGTDYPVIATLNPDDRALVTGRNEAGDWWQIAINGAGAEETGWVLGRLVTAENVSDVPVVAVAAPPIAPTTTLTPVVTPTAPPLVETGEETGEETDEETDEGAGEGIAEAVTVGEDNVPAAVGTSVPVTVTLTGDANNPERLATLLRMVLLSFSSSDAVVTATVGQLPDDLPISLTLPPTATVVGSVERTGDFASRQLFLTADGTPDALLRAVRDQLTDQGFTPPAQAVSGGTNQVFLSNDPRVTATLLCNQEAEVAVNLGSATLAGEGATVTLLVTPISRFSDPCSGDPGGAESEAFAALPQLAPPPQAQVRGSGGGSSTGTEGVSLTAEAEIETNLTVAELADHYEQQLAAAGWEQVEQSRTDTLAWSAWSFIDEDGNTWTVIFYIVEGNDTGEYIATLRAESQS